MSDMSDEALDGVLRSHAPDPELGEPRLDPGELQAWRTGQLDADAAAEVEQVLAGSAADRAVLGELAAPVSDALLDRMAGAAPGGAEPSGAEPRRGRRGVWIGAVLALAAALVVTVLRPGPSAPGEYAIGAVRGGVQTTRDGGPSTAARAVFVPAGTLRLTIRPAAAPSGPEPSARAFISRDGAALEAIEGLRAMGGGVWVLEGPASTLFGAAPAQVAVLVALADDAAALDGLAGQPAPAAEVTGAVRWVRLDVDYRTDEAAP